MLYEYFATATFDPEWKQTWIIWKESFYQYNIDEEIQQTKQEHAYQEKDNTYWRKPHHFKNPNCKGKIHEEDDE